MPADHLLRRVDEAVDFSAARRVTTRFCSHTGQLSVDPVVLFNWFIGYELDEAIPDHSVLSKARRRFDPTVYEAFFTEIVRRCEQAGLIRGDRLFLLG